MSANSKIEWCDHTFNPWIGCNAISPGCANCYAAAWAKRYGRDFADRTITKTWAQPKLWNAQAEAFHAQHGRRQRVFCASLADVFDNEVPLEWRSELFMLISETPNLDWLILTKRIGNAAKMLPAWFQDPEAWEFGNGVAHPNVWLGATVVNQEEADRDIPKLLDTPAAKRFLSMEPLLGPVDLTMLNNPGPLHQRGAFINALRGGTYGLVPNTGERYRITHGPLETIDWVIAGGESGPGARPSHPDWYRTLRDQCAAAGVPFLFKQWGEWMPPESRTTSYPAGDWRDVVDTTGEVRKVSYVGDRVLESSRQVVRVGKKAAGRLLDGVEHNGFPT